jgi:hypothetical protein
MALYFSTIMSNPELDVRPSGIYRQLVLENGLEIVFTDHSRVYFGDYHLVRLEIVCRAGEPAATAAAGHGGEFRRVVERMGVPSAAVDATRESLVQDFLSTSRAYLNAPDFPAKLAAATLRQQPKKVTPRYGEINA